MGEFYKSLILVCLLTLLPDGASATIERYEFDQIIESLQNLYQPDFRQKQQLLKITGYWESERMEASARYDQDYRGKIAAITITGAVARHPVVTEETFATIICHEIGHFLGGQPAVSKYSTEGQADYFAASACMRRLVPKQMEGIFTNPLRSPPIVKKRCEEAYGSEKEVETCIRSTMGGYGLSSFVAYRKSQAKPTFESQDQDEAKLLRFEPTTVQCRLDTFIAAALCNPSAKWHVDNNRPWLCSRKGNLAHLSRPVCWYPRTF